jgi:methylase of polypeptide subunit release factors
MTDIFSHAVIINNLCDRLKQKVRVLDVGTGHGYLAFLIAKILERRNIVDYSITGVDINEEAIQFCRNIHSKHYQIRGHLAF